MKKNLLFFTLLLSGLSTNIFAKRDDEKESTVSKEPPNYMKSTVSSTSKKTQKINSSKQENFVFGGKSAYKERPMEKEDLEEMLNLDNIKDSKLKDEIKILRNRYAESVKKRGKHAYIPSGKPAKPDNSDTNSTGFEDKDDVI